MQWVILAVILCAGAYLIIRRSRERDTNAPLRSEIQAQVLFETALARTEQLGTGGSGGTRGAWIPLRGPTKLTVGTDAFMITAPQALCEFAFAGRGTSITLSQLETPRPIGHGASRDWIVITGQYGGRQVQLAITQDNLPEIWQALSQSGAAPA